MKNNLVRRYHASVLAVFIVLVIAAIAMAITRYVHGFEAFKAEKYERLTKHADYLNNVLSGSVNALTGMRDFANYYLDNPDELSIQEPQLVQDGEHFYLAKANHDIIKYRQPLDANITGIGRIDEISPQLALELKMARALTPAFIAAEQINEEANWFYYTSYSNFISLYPWISRDTWQFTERTVNMEHMLAIAKVKKDQHDYFYWSRPYEDAAEKGLNTALAAPVFYGDKLAGAVVIDISLGKLHEKITKISSPDVGLLVIDKNNSILVHKTKGSEQVSANTSIANIEPKELTSLTYSSMYNHNKGFKLGDYFVQHTRIPLNDWIILRYQPYSNVVNQVTDQFLTSFLLSLTGLISLLVTIYYVTRRTFIKPTQEFIAHIEHSARGDHGVVRPPKGWRHWFQLVEDIFSQNRSLMQQLKDQNKILDLRVHEKTQALRDKSEQHQHDYAILRSVMDAIPDYLIFNDTHGNIIGCNLAFERLVGISESQMLGRKAPSLVYKEIADVLIENSNIHSLDKAFIKQVKAQGKTYDIFIEQFINGDKEVLGSIVMIRDITKQTEINLALEQAKNQAEQANRTKSQFLANMSHEIRTPINAIQGMHFLLSQSGLSSGQRIHLDNAQSASTALLHLVDELLDLAKIESGNMTMVKSRTSLDKVVNQALKLNIGLAASKGLAINVDIAPNVPMYVDTDEMRLVQVISNLINNAVKFTESGYINLSLSKLEQSEAQQSQAHQNEKNALVHFSVQDSGIGIAKDKQSFLFEAFRQADESMTRKYGGSGLGLSICQQIVNLLGGNIIIDSDEGEGATFSFTLPMSVQSTDNKLTLDKSYQFINAAPSLPETISENLTALAYPVTTLASVTELMNFVPKDKLPTVAFVDAEQCTETICQQLQQGLKNKAFDVEAFVLCQGQQQGTNINTLKWFDRYQLPYVVCEHPMYRYCLIRLFDDLRNALVVHQNVSQTNQASKAVNEIDTKANLSGINILLVEDNLVNQLVAKELLKSMEAEVVIAENGEKALHALQTQTFDLVLMDIQMPVMDGLTATKEIRKNPKFANLPIIAMTAHAREEDRLQSLEAGMDLHVSKPVKAELLLSSILQVLEEKAQACH
ncbi:response regulator [Thalassotalea ganghwensis]